MIPNVNANSKEVFTVIMFVTSDWKTNVYQCKYMQTHKNRQDKSCDSRDAVRYCKCNETTELIVRDASAHPTSAKILLGICRNSKFLGVGVGVWE